MRWMRGCRIGGKVGRIGWSPRHPMTMTTNAMKTRSHSRSFAWERMGLVAIRAILISLSPRSSLMMYCSVFFVYAVLIVVLSMVFKSDLASVALLVLPLHAVLLVLLLHAAWFSAWSALGHPPRPSANDPKGFGPPVRWFLAATTISMRTYIHIIAASVATDFARFLTVMINGKSLKAVKFFPLIARFALWVAAPVYVMLEPFHIAMWIMD